ncbi:MAG: SDR family NAD(P)-dependent oxidoreductase [Verrucomicrobia bacterium]|nr:SDR family NAD(P)-dependent oxidoreductase [Verrucomicrobiota bacterium]
MAGRRILISGVNRGIGMALKERFLEGGDEVAGIVRTGFHEGGMSGDRKSGCVVLRGDVRDFASCESAAGELGRIWGSIDLLIHNAGVYPEMRESRFIETKRPDFELAMETNFFGAVNLTRAFMGLLEKSACPRIIFLGSGAGSVSSKEDSRSYCYGPSKAAVHMFARTLSYELLPPRWIISVISPGWVRTDMGGQNAMLSLEEVIEPLAQTMLKLEPAQHGQFLNRYGKTGEYAW